MTIRSSYGIFYDLPPSLFDYQFSLNPPWGDTITITSPKGLFDNPWLGTPSGNIFPTQLGANPYSVGATYVNMPLHVKPTYLEQWNISVQRQLGADWLVSASYMGNRTVHLWTSDQLNPAIYIPGNSTIGNTAARRLLTLENPTQGPFYSGGIYQLDDGGVGSYNGLLASLQRRMAHGVTLLANYTWSHCLSVPVDSVLGTTANYMNPANRQQDYGNCAPSDRRHVLNLSAVGQTPRFSERWLNLLAGGWQASAIVSAQSGSFINVTTGVDNALTGQSNQRRTWSAIRFRLRRASMAGSARRRSHRRPRAATAIWVSINSRDRACWAWTWRFPEYSPSESARSLNFARKRSMF